MTSTTFVQGSVHVSFMKEGGCLCKKVDPHFTPKRNMILKYVNGGEQSGVLVQPISHRSVRFLMCVCVHRVQFSVCVSVCLCVCTEHMSVCVCMCMHSVFVSVCVYKVHMCLCVYTVHLCVCMFVCVFGVCAPD
jgi:ABC-type uncharacterized transport system permease subunit